MGFVQSNELTWLECEIEEETEQNPTNWLLEMKQKDNSILPPRFLPWATGQIGVLLIYTFNVHIKAWYEL